MGKSSFIAMVVVTMALDAVPFTGAFAGDNSAATTRATPTRDHGLRPEYRRRDAAEHDQMQSIQQGIEDLKQGHDAAPDNYSPDDSTQSDDSSGHNRTGGGLN